MASLPIPLDPWLSHCHKASQLPPDMWGQGGVGGSAMARPRQDYFIPRVLLLPATARTWLGLI